MAPGSLGLLAATGGDTGRELIALGAALLVAGLLARAGRRVGLPTIPLFMAAGILTGPHTPGPVLTRHPGDLGLLTPLGLILLMFHLGLEFSLDDLLAGGRRLLVAGAVYLTVNLGGGLALGWGFGWGAKEAFVIAGIVGISSSAIATKLVVELGRLPNPETGLLLGIVVVEDVFLAVYLALLQPALGGARGGGAAVTSIAKGVVFLILLVALARWGRRPVGRLLGSGDDELLTLCAVGLAVLVAGVAANIGVSDAIGAVLAGQVVAATAVAHRVERLVLPLRDVFAAIFFFAFGLSVDPGALPSVAGPVLVAVTVTLCGCIVAGAAAARIQGLDRQAAANIGLTVVARGEFSLILATLAAAAGLDGRLAPFTAGYVLVLAIAGPLAASRSDLLARRLPARLFPAPALSGKEGP